MKNLSRNVLSAESTYSSLHFCNKLTLIILIRYSATLNTTNDRHLIFSQNKLSKTKKLVILQIKNIINVKSYLQMSAQVSRPTDPESAQYFDEMVNFINSSDTKCTFSGLNGAQRKKVHQLAPLFGLKHQSVTAGGNKVVEVEKMPSKNYLNIENIH